MKQRELDVVVISDLHLGTYGCQSELLLKYLKSIQPKILILNGDIIDIWNMRKSFFPSSHIKILRQILKLTEKGTQTYYITGNHDDALRRYSGIKIGNISLEDKLILNLDGKKIWIFHGDIFDATTKGSARIVAKLGGKGYDLLIWSNRMTNRFLDFFGWEKVSFSKKIKSSVKKAVSWINNFEVTAGRLAADQDFDIVICGHIHMAQMREMKFENRSILYLNSGDWVENCTALEYNNCAWSIYQVQDDPLFNMVHNEWEEEIINDKLSIEDYLVSNEYTVFNTSDRQRAHK